MCTLGWAFKHTLKCSFRCTLNSVCFEDRGDNLDKRKRYFKIDDKLFSTINY